MIDEGRLATALFAAVLLAAAPAAAQSVDIKHFADAGGAFAFDYPGDWGTIDHPDPDVPAVVATVSGTNCHLLSLALDVADADAGDPGRLPEALAELDVETVMGDYAPDEFARLLDLADGRLGVQAARRFEVAFRDPGSGDPYRIRSWLTYREGSLVKLTCGGREEDFTDPRMQAAIALIHDSFVFVE